MGLYTGYKESIFVNIETFPNPAAPKETSEVIFETFVQYGPGDNKEKYYKDFNFTA